MNARSLAIANENAEIDASQSRAVAERKPASALNSMASRLQITPANLMNTLKSTVFKGAGDAEFAALVVVCNEYGLNPLLKEIYAFPAKGGGIVPMVSIDGWIRIMNEHPQFDGIEFNYHNDAKGGTVAIESIIQRKDRAHPIKIIEYMDECKGTSGPWVKSPRRMLRHRALIQGARVAFGFSGIVSEGDEPEFIDIQSEPITLPPRQTIAEELDDEIPAFDQETGEVLAQDASGMTVIDEEAARALDAGESEEPATEGETPPWAETVATIKQGINEAANNGELKKVEAEYLKHAVMLPAEVAQEIEDMLRNKRG